MVLINPKKAVIIIKRAVREIITPQFGFVISFLSSWISEWNKIDVKIYKKRKREIKTNNNTNTITA